MTPAARLMTVVVSTLAMTAAVEAARAQPAAAPLILAANDVSTPAYGFGPTTTGRTLEWDSRKGRWGLKLGVEQRTDRLGETRDVQPGFYYKVTPRLHIGGAIDLAPTPLINPRVVDPQSTTPRVRLETTFKF